MAELLRQTLTELCRTLLEKQASPVELMRETLEAIDAHNPTLNAIVASRPREALIEDARVAEDRIMRGEARPLEGIPFGVKDLEDAAGLVTSYGAKPFATNLAERDSVQVARLRSAGAIVLGKTNAPEFGSTAITKNLLFGATRSPWNLDVTSGGSSGGSSSALAAEILPMVTASDGGGSIRIPASFVGAFGLKPSFGRIPKGPLDEWEHGATSVYGPLTKTVEDAALFLDQVVGHDPHDPRSLPHPGYRYADVLARPIDRALKIGFSPDFGSAIVQSDVAAAVEDAVKTFERLGHRVEALVGGPPHMGGEWGLLGAYEIGSRIASLRPEREDQFSRALMDVIRFSEAMTQRIWGQISDKRVQLVKWLVDAFSRYDLIVTPTVPYDAPPAKGPFPEYTEGRAHPTAGVAVFTIPFNLSWHPAASVRVGLSKRGLPIGMQIAGPHHRDDLVMQASLAFQRERPWHPEWPLRSGHRPL
jgi:Asp-tRNA(Asn)/Glu-tRNA(Gln) amidotransferase A subunit family amidase